MDIALLTPTYAGDLQRFRILRESLEAAGVNWPHYAVVQTEDLPAFRAAGLPSRGLHWLSTAEVLAPELEADRIRLAAHGPRWRKLRRSLNKRFGWFPDASRDGWHTQQIVKLDLPARLGADIVVTLDSDVIVARCPDITQFTRDGKIALHTSTSTGRHAHPQWVGAARRILQLPPQTAVHDNFVAHPFVFSRSVTSALHRWLEQTYSEPWWRVLLSQRAALLSEFEVYGHFAKSVYGMKGLYEVPRNGRTRWAFTGEDHGNMRGIIDDVFGGDRYDVLVINANRHWPIEPYLPMLREAMSRRAES